MKSRFVLVASALIAAAVLIAIPVIARSQAKDNDPTYDEIRLKQELGRTIVSPDGHFFLYEWTRPYDWARDFGSLPPEVSKHMQCWLYRVDVDQFPATSDYIFYPDPGASYWLGSLSPDSKKVSFYELDDDNTLKAGVWDFAKTKLTTFRLPPDAKRLEIGPIWVSNSEIVYPGSTAKFVKASTLNGRATPCAECGSVVKNPGSKGQNTSLPDLGPDTRLLARSKKGDLVIWSKDTSDVLTLMFKKGSGEPQTLFENKRHNENAAGSH